MPELEIPCLEWLGRTTKQGYAIAHIDGKEVRLHRRQWSFDHGPVPPGMCILHKCDNPPCVEPTHLFLGTRSDNARDMIAKGRCRSGGWGGAYGPPRGTSKVTHCPKGHEYTPENTYNYGKFGRLHRQCKQCKCKAQRDKRRNAK